MKNFGGGEGEPDEAVGDDEDAESAPDDETHAVKRRRGFAGVSTRIAREFAGPAVPEAAEAVGDFCGGKQNHQSNTEDSGADQILNERIAHCARI